MDRASNDGGRRLIQRKLGFRSRFGRDVRERVSIRARFWNLELSILILLQIF